LFLPYFFLLLVKLGFVVDVGRLIVVFVIIC
jgi:hypothetical protein